MSSKIAGYIKRRAVLIRRCDEVETSFPDGPPDYATEAEIAELRKQIDTLGRKIEALTQEQQRSSK